MVTRLDAAIRFHGTTTNYGSTFFENEKAAYPKAMCSYLLGVATGNSSYTTGAQNFLQGNAVYDTGANLTNMVDFYPSFTLLGQMPKYFWFGKHANYLSASYQAQMVTGADLWADDNWTTASGTPYPNPLGRPHPAWDGVNSGGWGPEDRNSWVDIRTTDNLKSMRDAAVYLFAAESGNTGNQATYKNTMRTYVNRLYRTGVSEWDSQNYFPWSVGPWLSIHSFAPETDVRLWGKAVADLWLTTGALKYWRSGFNAPSKRTNGNSYVPFGAPASHILNVYFGDAPVVDAAPDGNSFYPALHSYRPPLATVGLAKKEFGPVEMINGKPPYGNWGADVTNPEFWETLYQGKTFQLASLVSQSVSGDTAPFGMLVENATRGAESFVAWSGTGSAQYDPPNGTRSGDQMAQHREMLIWLRPADGLTFTFRVPSSAILEITGGVWFYRFANNKTWMAIRPLGLTYASSSLGTGVYTAETQHVATGSTTSGYEGFAMEVGEDPGYSSYAAFKREILNRGSIDSAQLSTGYVRVDSPKGGYLAMQYNSLEPRPSIYRNSATPFDWNNVANRTLYSSRQVPPQTTLRTPLNNATIASGTNVVINADAASVLSEPISLGWKTSTLTVRAGGYLFTQTLDNSTGDVLSWSEVADTPPNTLAKVEYYVDGAKVGEQLSGPFSFTSSGLADGAHTIRAKAIGTDGQESWTEQSTISLGAATNLPPEITVAQDGSVQAPFFGLQGSVSDPDGSVALVQVFRDNVLAGNATVNNGAWTFSFTGLASGTYTFLARAFDDQSATTDVSLTATIDTNAPPTIAAIPNQSTPTSTPTNPIAITINDDLTALNSLVVSASSSNELVVANTGLALGGSGGNRTLVATPVTGAVGTTNITVTVNDGAKQAARLFTLTVNTPPVATSIVLTPTNPAIQPNNTLQFDALLRDQYGNDFDPQPAFVWNVTGGGTINATGLFTASAATGGPFTITAEAASLTGTTTFIVGTPPPAGWDGDTDTVFSSASNWVGNIAPANDLTSSTGVFTSGLVIFQPRLSGNRSIKGLDFQSAGWTLSAASGTLSVGAGGVDSAGSGTNAITAPVSVAAAGGTWSIAPGNTLNAASTLSGGSAFTVDGGGTLALSGTTANTQTGNVTLAAGTTILVDKTSVAAFTNQRIVDVSGTVRWMQNGVASGTPQFTVRTGGVLDTNGFNADFAFSGNEKITLSGGTVQTGAGVWKFTGNNAVDAQVNGTTVSTITGNVDFGAAATARNIKVLDNAPGLDLDFAANITQGGLLIIKGNNTTTASEARLAGNNSAFGAGFNFGTSTEQLIAYLDHANALGSGAGTGSNVVAAGSTLVLRGGLAYAETGSTQMQFHTTPGFRSASGDNSWQGSIGNPGGSSAVPGHIQVDAGTLTVTGSLGGFSSTSRQLGKTGNGALIYDNAATNIAGNLFINGGTFALKPVGEVNTRAANTALNGGTLAAPDNIALSLGASGTANSVRFGGAGGGFAAYGADITVDITGATTMTWGGGTTAAALTGVQTGGVITSITGFYFGGAGYTGAETATFSGGAGTGATGTIVVTNGVVTGINITSGGSSYTSNPTLTIAAPTRDGGTTNYLANSAPLILNSTLSQHKVTLLDNIDLAAAAATFTGQREIRVLDNPASANDFAVIDATISSSKPGIGITKTGAGLLVLPVGRTHTFSGPTSISAGTLLVNGSISGAASVSGGATLAGSGSIAGSLIIDGTIAPVGTLSTGSATWNGSAPNAWRTDPGDLLNITGNFVKGSGSVFAFDLGGLGGAGTSTLVQWTGSTTFSASDFTATNVPVGLNAAFQITGTQLKLVLTGSPFSAWQNDAPTWATVPIADRDPLDDADADGLVNLLEYALGTSPSLATPAPVPSINGSGRLQISFTRPTGRTDITTVGEASENLTIWTAPVETIITNNGNGTETVIVRVPAAAPANAKTFLRVKVSIAQ